MPAVLVRRKAAPRPASRPRRRVAFEVTANPQDETITQFARRVEGWLRGRGLRVRAMRIGDIKNYEGRTARLGDIVEVDPSSRREFIAANRRDRSRLMTKPTPRQLWGLHVMIHESLHGLPHKGGRSYATEEHRAWEEGAVDAVTRDILPIAVRQFFGYPMTAREVPGNGYDKHVMAVRGWSISAGGPWEGPRPTAWRRAFLRAGREQRKRMVADAEAWWATVRAP